MAAIASCGSRCLHTSLQITASSCHKDVGCSSSSSRYLRRVAGRRRITGGNVAAMTRKREVVAAGGNQGNGRDRRDVKLDEEDMMTLEFGRLLGESRETTLSKIFRSKADPDAKFLDIEEALQKGTPARSLVKPAKQGLRESQQLSSNAKPRKVPEPEDTVPELMSRPARPRGIQEAVGPGARVVKPQSKKAKAEEYDYSQLIRKPVIVSAMNGLPPEMSPVEVVPPMTMRRATQSVTAAPLPLNSGLLRKPSLATLNQPPGEQVTSDGDVTTSGPSTSIEANGGAAYQSPLQPPARELSPLQPKPTATLLPKPADVVMPSSKLPETNDDSIDGLPDSSYCLISDDVSQESGGEVEGWIGAGEETVSADRYAGWSEEVQTALLKREDPADADELGSQEPDALATGRPSERKQGLLRRPAAPHIADAPTLSAKQLLQETRPYVPKPLTVVPPDRHRLEASEDALQSLSKKIMSSPDEELKADESNDSHWAQAEALHDSLSVIDVEILRLAGDGVLASFGPLFAYLPVWELSNDRGIPSFSSWAQSRGMDVTQRKAGFGVSAQPREERDQAMTGSTRSSGRDSADLDLVVPSPEERQSLLEAYKKERETRLTALIGKKASVVITAVDKARQKLVISERRSEGAAFELAQKKASVIASLKIGDVITCVVRRVNSIGAFVEVEGVPALIHSSELSWNRVTDPSTVLSVGQEVQVRVCRLDRHLQRISLSLRQMQADPLQETLESLVSSKDITARAAEVSEQELPELVELKPVLNRLLKTDGVYSVVRGRGFRGAALATSFQIYLSEPVSDGYKLLARAGNAVQEILVQTSLTKEEMKKVIFSCVVEGDDEVQV